MGYMSIKNPKIQSLVVVPPFCPIFGAFQRHYNFLSITTYALSPLS